MNWEFIEYIDCISSMCVDCIGGGITQQTYLSNLKLMIPKMSELLADPELGPYEVECGFPKRKHGMKLQEKHLCSKCKWQTCCELPRPPRVYKCSDFEPQPEQFKVEPGELKYCKEHRTIHCSCQQREIDRLKAENKRLREALKPIYEHCKNNMQICGIVEQAKAALKGN